MRTVYSGAEAVFRMLSYGSRVGSGFGLWCYRQVPGFAAASQYGYRFVADHRTLAATVTQVLWGKGEDAVCRPTYFQARAWFLRVLGLIYLIAFWSFWSADRWIDWTRWNSAGGALAGRTAEPIRGGGLPIVSDALLVQCQRSFSALYYVELESF